MCVCLWVCGGGVGRAAAHSPKFRPFSTRSHLPACSSDAVPTPSNDSAAPAPAGVWNYSREARRCREPRRAEPGGAEAQARSNETPRLARARRTPAPAAPSPSRSRAGRFVTAHALLAAGQWGGGGGVRGFSRLPLRGTMPPFPFLRSISLKNSLRAERLATGSAFPHPLCPLRVP